MKNRFDKSGKQSGKQSRKQPGERPNQQSGRQSGKPSRKQPNNEQICVEITGISNDGSGVGRTPSGKAIFIPETLPGEHVNALIIKDSKNYCIGKLTDIVVRSPHRQTPFCPSYKQCGGCSLQHATYAEQTCLKTDTVASALQHIGDIPADTLASILSPTISMQTPYAYRNKVQYPVERGQIGFYAKHSHRIVEHTECKIQPDVCRRVKEAIKSYLAEIGCSTYSEASSDGANAVLTKAEAGSSRADSDSGRADSSSRRTRRARNGSGRNSAHIHQGSGLLRNIFVRVGINTGEVMVILVINGQPNELPQHDKLIEIIRNAVEEPNVSAVPDEIIQEVEHDTLDVIANVEANAEVSAEVKVEVNTENGMASVPNTRLSCVFVNTNTSTGNVIMGRKTTKLFGTDFITERIGHATYQISPESFFQVNTHQCEVLYGVVREFATTVKPIDRIFDLYCGAGTIGIYLADLAKQIVGIEVIPSAVQDAKRNASLNEVSNATYICGEAETVLSSVSLTDTALQTATEVVTDKASDNVPNIKTSAEQNDLIIVDPPRKGCDERVLTAINDSGVKTLIYVSCDPATLARDIKRLYNMDNDGFEWQVKRVQPVDMFPWTSHVETVVLMSRVR